MVPQPDDLALVEHRVPAGPAGPTLPARTPSRSPAARRAAAGLAGWAGLGLLGSAAVAFEGTRLLGSGGVRWWFTAPFPAGHDVTKALFWAAVAALCAAWLGLGRALRRSPAVRLRHLWVIAALWCVPLLVGPPLFSRDVYSYFAQGTLVHLGHSPYHQAPVALAHLGRARVLAGVDPFWRRSTAPYGPLFLAVISLIAGAVGSQLVLGATLIRLFDLLGLVLLAVFIPRLARACGADPRRALWLAALSPLVLLQLVSPAHNDALMVGLMVAGVAAAARRRYVLAIAVCALAATVKAPAAIAIAFIVAAWVRALPTARGRLGAIAAAAAVTGAVVAAVALLTGLGMAWISTGLFNTPGRVRLSITPATAVGYSAAHLLHDLGVTLDGKRLEATLTHVAFGLTAALGAWLLYRTRRENMVRQLGLLLVALAIGGPAAWPWYFTWGLALLACLPRVQRSRLLALAIVIPAFVIIPTGQLALTLGASPYMVALYAALAALAGWRWRARRRALAAVGAPSMLAGA